MKPPRIKKYCAGGLATRGRELSCACTVLVLCSRIDVRDGIRVRYGAGRGGFSLARPRPYNGPGGVILGVTPAPPPSGASPRSFPGRGPVSPHLF